MKRFIIQIITLLVAATGFAQTQQGYVKTLGRPEKAGEPLSGVTIRVKGEHNSVNSHDDGTFSLLMTDKKNGEAYALQQVQKNGYELNETDILGRQFAFSDKVPLTIVMVSSEQLRAEKQRIESNAYRTAEKNYKAKVAQIEKQLQDSVITLQQYRESLLDLQDKFEKYQSLIDGLAEHYAHTDYDFLNEKDREINLCIENGALERADSLIRLLFDPIGVLERNMEALAAIEQQIGQANDIIAQANEDMANVLKQQEKDAEYLYQLYTIALSRYDNEKALFYVETRAALDTTNVDWMMDASEFIYRYFARYDDALNYSRKIIALANESQDYQSVARAYTNMGKIYCDLTDYDNSLIYLDSAINIVQRHFGEENVLTSLALNQKGIVFTQLHQLDKGSEFFNKALNLNIVLFGENSSYVAGNYYNIGALMHSAGKFKDAMEYYNKALAFFDKDEDKYAFEMAGLLDNMGDIYGQLGDFQKALDTKKTVLQKRIKRVGFQHPAVASSYHNVGVYFGAMQIPDSAIYYYSIAYDIRKNIFGTNHPVAVDSYAAMGTEYVTKKDYDKAKKILLESLNNLDNTIGLHNATAADIFTYLSEIAVEEQRYDDALQYTNNLMEIYGDIFGKSHPNYAIVLNSLADIYNATEDYQKAYEYYTMAYELLKSLMPESHPAVQLVKENMEAARAKLKQ